LAIGFAYKSKVLIDVVVLLPHDRPRLLAHLNNMTYNDYVRGIKDDSDTVTKDCLLGC
jgi:hypothetical protein